MSRHARLPAAASGAPDQRPRQSSSNSAKTGYDLGGGHSEDICCNSTGHVKVTKDVSQHRRVASASEINLKKLQEGQLWEKQSRDESIPEPSKDMDEAQRQTWQTQWADALKKVQAFRLSGAGTQSDRWSGVATDIYRPKSLTTRGTQDTLTARTSHAPTASLDRWNYYPGPSVNGDFPRSQLDNTIPESGNVGADDRNKSLRGGADSIRKGKLFGGRTQGNLLKGRGSKSITILGKLDPTLETERSRNSDFNKEAEQEGRSPANLSTTPSQDQFDELQRPELYSVLASRVKRAQSHRDGRLWGQKPDANHPSDGNSSTVVPTPILKKAISMREGGAHQDAVMEMARAYTDTVCGLPKTLECASCGRNLGFIVQGNPGVDTAFCQACRPSPLHWKKPISVNAAGPGKKNVIMQFCRKILRLDKKSKLSEISKE